MMTRRPQVLFTNEQAFYVILLGQLVSTIGSGMTRFGLGFWVFAETGDASAYTTLLFFAVLPLGLGSLLAGPLAEFVFNPLFLDGGRLANSVGQLIGVGQGRGMGFMFILIGGGMILLALLSALSPSIRFLEDRVPDFEESA
ncbi:MAG: hypothetical protein AAF633_08085, partial [Chloroflexota bacterium]